MRRSVYLVENPAPSDVAQQPGETRTSFTKREVHEQGLALHVLPRHEAPVAAILRVVAIVSHHEVVPFWHRHRAVGAPDVERPFTKVAAGGINWKQEMNVRLVE